MESALSIPADIFEEMAGMKEIEPPKNETKEDNVKSETVVTPINLKRLTEGSLAMVSKVQKKLCNSFYKVAKKLFEYQKQDSPVKTKGRTIEVLIRFQETFSETAAKVFSKKFWSWQNILRMAWFAIRSTIKILFNLIKWLTKLVLNIVTKLTKLFARMAKGIARAIRPVLRLVGRMIKKMSKWIFKMIKLILKAVWKIVKKLFFRGKSMLKMFKGEPADKAMKQPALPKKKNKMKLKLKAIGKKASFIMKVIKKMFKALGKMLWKLIKKIFGKVITKIVKTFVRMIVKFIAAQVIGSLIPGLGNAIMGALSIALLALDVVMLVGFIAEISSDTASLADDVEPEPDEGDEPDEDDVDIDSMNMEEVKSFMETLAANGKENSPDYLEAKARYLELLSENYEKAGDAEIAEMIRLAAETGEIVTDPDIDLKPAENEEEAIKKVDIAELQRTIEKRQKELAALKWERKRENVFEDKEIKTLLTGEVDGGPLWVSIWQDFLWFIGENMRFRLPDKDVFEYICREVTYPYPQKQVKEFILKAKWTYESQNQRDKRVEAGADKILNEENKDYHYSSLDEFGEQDKFDKVIDRVNKYKFSLSDETKQMTDTKVGENMLQKYKYFRWEDILNILLTKEQKVWTIDELMDCEDISIGAKLLLTSAKLGLPV